MTYSIAKRVRPGGSVYWACSCGMQFSHQLDGRKHLAQAHSYWPAGSGGQDADLDLQDLREEFAAALKQATREGKLIGLQAAVDALEQMELQARGDGWSWGETAFAALNTCREEIQGLLLAEEKR